jgi:uncharacterized membrane protein
LTERDSAADGEEASQPSVDATSQPTLTTAPTQVFPGFPGLPNGLPSQLIMSQLQVWQGQFPPPDAIERYERVMPGAFNRLMAMAERQQEAAIAAASGNRTFVQTATRRGHWMGFVVALVAMTGAGFCAYLRQPVIAALCLGVPVLSVAKALIDSAKSAHSAPPVSLPPAAQVMQPQPAT